MSLNRQITASSGLKDHALFGRGARTSKLYSVRATGCSKFEGSRAGTERESLVRETQVIVRFGNFGQSRHLGDLSRLNLVPGRNLRECTLENRDVISP